jgi:hypothetical protein
MRHRSFFISPPIMSELTPDLKHHILTQYLPSSHDNSFAALAHRYNIKGGKRTIQRWYARWDGTPASLERRAGAGRHRLLSSAQIRDTITLPILNHNRAHRPVHYTELLSSVRTKTGTSVSLPTIQRYGKQIVRARDRSTRSLTAAECQYTDIIRSSSASLCRVHRTNLANFLFLLCHLTFASLF